MGKKEQAPRPCGTTRSWKYMALNMLSATCIARIESGTLLFPAARQHSIKGAPAGQGESSRREGSVGERIVHAQDSIRPGDAVVAWCAEHQIDKREVEKATRAARAGKGKEDQKKS